MNPMLAHAVCTTDGARWAVAHLTVAALLTMRGLQPTGQFDSDAFAQAAEQFAEQTPAIRPWVCPQRYQLLALQLFWVRSLDDINPSRGLPSVHHSGTTNTASASDSVVPRASHKQTA
jgi:hypothetical protein